MSYIPVIKRSFDPNNSGANLQETILTQAAVSTRGLVRTRSIPLPGDARGSEGMSLIAPNQVMKDGKAHNLLIQATMGNIVNAFDADDPTNNLPLWSQKIAAPVVGTRQMDMYLINQNWGILSCPVLHPIAMVIYIVAMYGPYESSSFWLHALSPIDGRDVLPPVDLTLATYQSPVKGVALTKMGTVPRKQRCALAMSPGSKYIYVANGSFNEDASTNQGWLIAVDVSTPNPFIDATFTTSSGLEGGSGGGLWMGGASPAVDAATGDIFLTSGNGDFDAVSNWGETVLRLGHTPGKIWVKDHFTPFTDTGVTLGAKYQTVASVDSISDQDADNDGDKSTSNMDDAGDSDLNSGGTLVIQQAASGLPWKIVAVCGKHGIGYFIDGDNMGNTQLSDFDPAKIQENVYGPLLCPPLWLTHYNPTASPSPSDLSLIPTTYLNRTHHLHSTCVFYKSSIHGPMIFCMGENSNVRAYSLKAVNGKLVVTYLACSIEYASPQAPVPSGGMPGGMMTLSANGDIPGTALLHVCYPYGNANNTITGGIYAVFDPENFGTFSDGSGWMKKLWSTDQWNIRFMHNKFCIPSPVNGRIYIPTYNATIDIYELTPGV